MGRSGTDPSSAETGTGQGRTAPGGDEHGAGWRREARVAYEAEQRQREVASCRVAANLSLAGSTGRCFASGGGWIRYRYAARQSCTVWYERYMSLTSEPRGGERRTCAREGELGRQSVVDAEDAALGLAGEAPVPVAVRVGAAKEVGAAMNGERDGHVVEVAGPGVLLVMVRRGAAEECLAAVCLALRTCRSSLRLSLGF